MQSFKFAVPRFVVSPSAFTDGSEDLWPKPFTFSAERDIKADTTLHTYRVSLETFYDETYDANKCTDGRNDVPLTGDYLYKLYHGMLQPEEYVPNVLMECDLRATRAFLEARLKTVVKILENNFETVPVLTFVEAYGSYDRFGTAVPNESCLIKCFAYTYPDTKWARRYLWCLAAYNIVCTLLVRDCMKVTRYPIPAMDRVYPYETEVELWGILDRYGLEELDGVLLPCTFQGLQNLDFFNATLAREGTQVIPLYDTF